MLVELLVSRSHKIIFHCVIFLVVKINDKIVKFVKFATLFSYENLAFQSFLTLFSHLKEIIERVKEGEVPPYRPIVTQFITEVGELHDLMKLCWAEDPDKRPDFHEIKKIVFKSLSIHGM